MEFDAMTGPSPMPTCLICSATTASYLDTCEQRGPSLCPSSSSVLKILLCGTSKRRLAEESVEMNTKDKDLQMGFQLACYCSPCFNLLTLMDRTLREIQVLETTLAQSASTLENRLLESWRGTEPDEAESLIEPVLQLRQKLYEGELSSVTSCTS